MKNSAIVLAMSVFASTGALAGDGPHFKSGLRLFNQLQEMAKSDADQINAANVFGYITAVADGFSGDKICMPDGITPVQLTADVAAEIERDYSVKELQKYGADFVVFYALSKKYSCNAKSAFASTGALAGDGPHFKSGLHLFNQLQEMAKSDADKIVTANVLGYITSVADSFSGTKFCMPDGIESFRLAADVLSEIERSYDVAELQESGAESVVYYALSKKYPCQAKSAKK